MTAKLQKSLNATKIISFDIFDTLLVRPYVKPVDLFAHIEKLENAQGFSSARILAESAARHRERERERERVIRKKLPLTKYMSK